MIAALRQRLADEDEQGSAIIEFLFVALFAFIPLIYLIVAVSAIQRGRASVTGAARDVGRALATSQSVGDIQQHAKVALRIALHNQGLSADDAQLKYVGAAASCSAAAIVPQFAPGAEFTVCVIIHQQIPAVPSIVSGDGVTLVGRYLVHLDDYRLVDP